jgi:hypothetical protein
MKSEKMTGIIKTLKTLKLIPVIYWQREENPLLSLFPLVSLYSINRLLIVNKMSV